MLRFSRLHGWMCPISIRHPKLPPCVFQRGRHYHPNGWWNITLSNFEKRNNNFYFCRWIGWLVSPWLLAHSESEDQEVIQQGSGGYTTRIRWLYYKNQEVMFSDAIFFLDIFKFLLLFWVFFMPENLVFGFSSRKTFL